MPLQRYIFPRTHRLLTAAQFESIKSARAVKHAGPLRIGAAPNNLPHPRIGLAVSKRVGNAPTRNAVKRRLREAFRLAQHDLPPGYDFFISVRPHPTAKMQAYQQWLRQAASQLDQHWRKQARRTP